MKKYALICAWLISCFGTLLSVYFSFILKIEPCLLCYYQRICLFPLTVILGIAAYDDFTAIKKYVIGLPIIGMLIALYQVVLQEIPGMHLDICGRNRVSCSTKIYLWDPVTLPMAAALAFFIITLLLIIGNKRAKFKSHP